jgi:hypothetical protein
VMVAATVLVACGHAGSRFRPFPKPGRFLLTAVADVPLIGAYLSGRVVGSTRHVMSHRQGLR